MLSGGAEKHHVCSSFSPPVTSSSAGNNSHNSLQKIPDCLNSEPPPPSLVSHDPHNRGEHRRSNRMCTTRWEAGAGSDLSPPTPNPASSYLRFEPHEQLSIHPFCPVDPRGGGGRRSIVPSRSTMRRFSRGGRSVSARRRSAAWRPRVTSSSL